MPANSPVYIVDDDSDDRDFIAEVWLELGIKNELKFFASAHQLLNHLSVDNTIPFMIMSDVNLPVMSGFELRKKLLELHSPQARSVPFIFWSNTASPEQIQKAYDLSAHGFFIKDSTLPELKHSLKMIVQYWHKSLQPSG